MAYNISTAYYTINLRFATGGELATSLFDSNMLLLDQNSSTLASQFANTFQKKVLDKGSYNELLKYQVRGEVKQQQLTLLFGPSKSKVIHPAFEATFDYYYWASEKRYWALVPALGVEAIADKEKDLEKIIEQNIRLEFVRNQRMGAMSRLVAALWLETVELKTNQLSLRIHSPRELEKLQQDGREELLPKVATKITLVRNKLYGRKEEIQQLVRMAKGKFSRNILLVGASGVGKTALVWELARQQKRLRIKETIWETTASTLIKELTMDTGWEDNLAYLCKELSSKGDFLFVRNLSELFEVGQYEGNSMSMAEYLREYLSRGEVNLISECSEEEYARIDRLSPNFLPLFQILRIEEPKEELQEIITKSIQDFAGNLGIHIELNAILETIRLNRRFTPYAGFPGKPIRFLESVILHQKVNLANSATGIPSIDRSEVIKHFCEETGMPAFIVDPSVSMPLNGVRNFFDSNIYGQPLAVNSVVDLLASVKAALTRKGKPIASFLFVGPTGVGKTEMAKVLAAFMFGNRNRMIRFDMSEYSNPYSVMRLTGESFFQDGLLTSSVRREPFSVVLFDEIEKADPTFYDLLLQLLSEGRLTDSSGQLVNFCSTIIIMTSNIGASNLQEGKISWKSTVDTQEISSHFMSAVKKHFRPELFGRIDKVIPFEPLSQEVVRHVVEREIKLFKKREGIFHRRIDLYLDDSLLIWLSEKGYSPKYGARQLQRTVREEVITPLAKQLNIKNFDDHLIVNIDCKKGTPNIQIEADEMKIDLLLEELERNNWAEHAADLRRAFHRLLEGRVFIRLLSELDILEGKLKRKKERFWQDEHLANKYTNLLSTKELCLETSRVIEGYERDFVLTCMGMRMYQMDIIDHIKAWEQDCLAVKMKLYGDLNPEFSSCTLAIYGQEVGVYLDFYIALLERKNLVFEIKTVWYRDDYFHELILPEPDEEGNIMTKKVPRHEYVLLPFMPNHKDNFTPVEEDDQLLGVEIQVNGPASYLFLESERGLHRWKVDDKTMLRYVIETRPKDAERPLNLHQKDFFENRVSRRTLEPEYLTDSNYDIKREVTKEGHLDLILEVLDKRFSLRLDGQLI